MFSLIKKDFLIQKNQFLLYAVIVTFFAFLDKAPIFIGFVFSLSFIMNANLYDEKDNSNLLLNSLPYTVSPK